MTAQNMLYSVGAKQEQHSQCLLGPFAFREFPAENCLAWKAERGADKHQTTSTSCISRAHGRFCLGAWRHSHCGWAGLRGYTNIALVLKKAAMSMWGVAFWTERNVALQHSRGAGGWTVDCYVCQRLLAP